MSRTYRNTPEDRKARAHELDGLSVRLASESVRKGRAMMRGDTKGVEIHQRNMDEIFGELADITGTVPDEGGAQ